MFERFTAAAREVVLAARNEGTGLGHHYVGTEHLLLGLLTSSAGPAARVLLDAELSQEYVRSEVLRRMGTGPGTLGVGDAEALRAIGIDLDAVRCKLEGSFGEGVLDAPSGGSPSGLPFRAGVRFTRRAKKILVLALREARLLGHDYIGAEHILLGLIREREGIAGQILASKEPLETLRRRVLAELERAA